MLVGWQDGFDSSLGQRPGNVLGQSGNPQVFQHESF